MSRRILLSCQTQKKKTKTVIESFCKASFDQSAVGSLELICPYSLYSRSTCRCYPLRTHEMQVSGALESFLLGGGGPVDPRPEAHAFRYLGRDLPWPQSF